MSETVHYKGNATLVVVPPGKTLIEVAMGILKEHNVRIESYHDNAIECLCDTYYREYFFHPKTQSLYELDNVEHEPDDEIILANLEPDNSITYELRYYNGGAGFDECLEKAFNKLTEKE